MPQSLIALLYAMGAGATGMVGVTNLMPLLQAPSSPQLGLGEAIGGALLILCVYLFRVSREHDKLGAELKARVERAEKDVTRLDQAERTVDTRIMESRHLQNNTFQEKLSSIEERLGDRLDKIETKLDRWMETHNGRSGA